MSNEPISKGRRITGVVHPEDVDVRREVLKQQILEEAFKSINQDDNANRKTRVVFAWILVGTFVMQILAAFAFLIGLEKLVVDEWVGTVFFGGVFVETSILLGFVVKFFFKDRAVQRITALTDALGG